MGGKDSYKSKSLNLKKGVKNQYRFQSFGDRISNVNIDILHDIHRDTDLVPHGGEQSSFFQEQLEEFSEMNITADFSAFVREVTPLCGSMAEVVFHQDKIVEVLRTHLAVPNSNALEHLLRLTATLARDLRQELYPHFEKIVLDLVALVDPSDSGKLEQIFTTISFLFKFLLKQLVDDVDAVFTYYETLLVHDKWFVRRFAAESFALIVRKVPLKAFAPLVASILHRAENLPEDVDQELFCHGVSELFCEITKGAQRHLYSRTHAYAPVLLSALENVRDDSPTFQIIYRAFHLIGMHVAGEHSTDVWTCFEKHIAELLKSLQKNPNKARSDYLGLLLLIVSDWLTMYKGVKVDNPKRVLALGSMVLDPAVLATGLNQLPHHALLKFMGNIYMYRGVDTQSLCTTHIKQLVKHDVEPATLRSVLSLLVDCAPAPFFKSNLLPSFWKLCNEHIVEQTDIVVHHILQVTDKVPSVKVPAFGKSGGRDDQLSPPLEHAISVMKTSSPENIPLSVIVLLPRCHLDSPVVRPKVIKVLVKVIKKLASEVVKAAFREALVDRYAAAIMALPPGVDSPVLEVTSTLVRTMLEHQCHAIPSLVSALKYLTSTLKEDAKQWEKFLEDMPVDDIRSMLLKNLDAPNRNLRKETLTVLAGLPVIPLDLSAIDRKEESLIHTLSSVSFFDVCLEMVSMDISIDTERARSGVIRRLGVLASNKRLCDLHLRALIRVGFGVLKNKLTILWPTAIEAIQAVANVNFELFWEEYWPLHRDIIEAAKEYIFVEREHIRHKTESKFLRRAGHKTDVVVETPALAVGENFATEAIADAFQTMVSPVADPATDTHTLHRLAWDILTGIPSLAQRRARDIIPEFFSFMDKEYLPLKTMPGADAEDVDQTKPTHKAARQKLVSYLSMFAKFKNPKSLARTEDLHKVLENLLATTSSAVQLLALKCLGTWHHAYLTPYVEQMESLIGDTTFKDALVNFPVSIDAGLIQTEHRPDLIPLIIRVVYAKLLQRKGRKGSLSVQRASLLSYLSSLEADELEFFFDIMTDSYPDNGITQGMDLSQVPVIVQLGYMNMLEDVIRHLSRKMIPYLKRTIPLILDSFEFAVSAEAKDSEESKTRSMIRSIRLQSIRRLCEIFYKFPEYDYGDMIKRAMTLFLPYTKMLPVENTQSRAGILELLVALSSHKKLASWLKGTVIIPSVLKLLTAPSVALEVQTAVMDILESLLEHASSILEPHIPELLKHLRVLIIERSAYTDAPSSRVMGTNLSVRILNVLSRISTNVKSREQGAEIFGLLLPFLKKSTTIKKESTKCDILNTLKNLMRHLPLPLTCVSFLARQFSVIKGLRARLTLADVFQEIARLMPEYAITARICAGLNALTAGVDEEYDYEARLKTFAEFNDQLHKECTPTHMYPIFYNLLHFAHDADMSIRSSAAHGLLQVCRLIASKPADDPNASGSYRNLLERAILPAVKVRMAANSESVRHEFIKILGALCKLFPDVLTDMQCLINDDVEVDFFTNIVHIQTHRRVRALARFTAFADEGLFQISTLVRIFVPLFSRMAAEAKEKDHNVVDGAVQAIGASAKKLPWRPYLGILLRQVKLVLASDERIALRILCTTLAAFHFNLGAELQHRDSGIPDVLAKTATPDVGDEEDEEDEKADESESAEEEDPAARRRRFEKMEDALINLCLRPLQSFIAGKHASKTARIPIIAAIASVLSKLSRAALDAELPKIFLVLGNHLKSREQHVRDAARETLVAVIKTVGEDQFGLALSILRRQLAKGYQVHVLVYTLNYMLRDVASYAKPGFLDRSIHECCDVLLDEIFGKVAEEKDVDAVANKMKETKSRKSLDSFLLLASLVTFRPYVRSLVQPLQDGLVVHANSLKNIRKYKEIFSRVIQGLAENPSVEAPDFLMYTHYLIQSSIPEKKATASEAAKKPSAKKPRIVVPSQFIVGDVMLRNAQAVNAAKIRADGAVDMHVLGEFGLDLLYRFLKQNRFDTKNQKEMEMLDPFVGLLVRCLRSKWNQTVTVALRALGVLIRCPLPNLPASVPEIGNRIFSLSKRAGSLGEELVVSCWKVLTVILRECPYYEVDENQLVHYLTVLSVDLEVPAKHNTAFALIRGILSRKLVLPQVYDLITRIGAVLVRSQSKPIRDLCAQVFYEFLLNYPLGDKRVQSHFNFIMSNLDYEYESGRLSVLTLIHSLISKFPEELVIARATYFFVPLVTRLVNDSSKLCTELVAACLRGLLKRVNQAKRTELLGFIVQWLQQDHELLKRASLQVANLALDLDESYLETHRDFLVNVVKDLLLDGPQDNWESAVDDPQDSSWSLIYYALLFLEKLQAHGITLDSLIPTVWTALEPYLLCPSTWVRHTVSRIYGCFFARFDTTDAKALQGSISKLYPTPKSKKRPRKEIEASAACALNDRALRYRLLYAFSAQLQSVHLTVSVSDQSVKNMLFLLAWETHLGVNDDANQSSSDDDDASDEDGQDDQVIAGIRKKTPDNIERWFMHRLAYLARSGQQRRIAIFKFFAASAVRFGPEFIKRYLDRITSPLYRVLNNTATEEVQELHEIADEVGNLLQEVVGTTDYFQSYNKVRARIASKRQERKRARAMEAVIDPEKAALRKKRKHEKNKANRKRKMEDIRSRRVKVRIKRGNEPIMLNDEANDSL